METVGELNYEDFRTVVKLTDEVRDFLLRNKIGLDLSSRIPNTEHWYKNQLFEHLKDKRHKQFDLIYCGIFDNSKEYLPLENIVEELNLKKEDILFDGSVALLELKNKFVRWIVVKS